MKKVISGFLLEMSWIIAAEVNERSKARRVKSEDRSWKPRWDSGVPARVDIRKIIMVRHPEVMDGIRLKSVRRVMPRVRRRECRRRGGSWKPLVNTWSIVE